jgi:hypothetical protein
MATLGAILLAVGAFVVNAPTANAQEASAGSGLPRTITVVGEGKVKVEPDIARTNIGVDVVRPTVKEASAANKEIIDGVLAALKEAGIAEEDIQTSGFSVYAERYGPNGPLPEDQVNYRVTNNVTVVVRDLSKVGDVLDAAIEAGANNIYGVEFALDDPNTVESEARKKAIADAKAKAAELAELNDVELGQVISVSEVIGNMGYFAGNFSQAAAPALGGGGGPSIQPGQLNLVMQLQVVYEIAE